MRPGILTLTTDFGAHGPYVAAMKGIILGLAPEVKLVDVCHAIAPQNILEGAFVLASIVDAFPPGTVHLAVIDPGVGTDRRMVAARVAGQWFVLPDNGLLSGVLRGRTLEEVRELSNPRLRRPIVSNTFHGRDIMAPAAAHLLRGGDPAELGPLRDKVVKLANFNSREHLVGDTFRGFIGEVIFRDTFGNLITNVTGDQLRSKGHHTWTIQIGDETFTGPLHRTYGEEPPGSLIALEGSTGFIEVAVVNGDAARQLTVGPGATVCFSIGDEPR
ncbi:MAG: SAM-dependent chlorinase/fluorinase [Isosphaeraceae bacterium]|nr:SAM-dependent chlorinase/fluorinase [Isosphaeraceae bacterium]